MPRASQEPWAWFCLKMVSGYPEPLPLATVGNVSLTLIFILRAKNDGQSPCRQLPPHMRLIMARHLLGTCI